MNKNLKIYLEFFDDDQSTKYKTGYWIASADNASSPCFDGVGITPLDAMMQMARQMFEYIEVRQTKDLPNEV